MKKKEEKKYSGWGKQTYQKERWLIVCSKTTNHFLSKSVSTQIYRFKIVHFLPMFGQ